MEQSVKRELTAEELSSVSGGRSNLESVGYQVGRGLGWFYNNVIVGNPWW